MKLLPLNNKAGFGIIEVMIAAGILSVISVGTMTLIGNTTKSQRGIEGKSRQQELRTEIGFLMNEPQACLNTMTGVNVTTPSTALTSIKDGSAAPGVDRYISGSNDGSGLIRYSSFIANNWVVSPSNANRGTMDLTITVDKLGEVIGPKVLVFRIPLFVRKDAVTNLVLECYTLSGAMGGDSFWEASPTVPDAIFYNTGNVGIGNDAANFGLSVLKNNGAGYAAMFARDNASNGIAIGTSTGGTPAAMIQGLTSAGASTDITLNPNGGNVGIGTTAPNAKLHIATENLGTALNDVVEMQRTGGSNGNASFLDVRHIRTAAGSTWSQAGTRVQQKIDATWMGYLQFNGNGNDGGLSFGVGLTTTAPGNVLEAMRINSSGNVGIGTTAPQTKLDVAGEIVTRNRFSMTQNLTDTSGTIPTWHMDNSADNFRIFRQPNLTTGGSVMMNISNTGQVRATNEVQVSQVGTGASGQFRSVHGNYGVIERNDGGNYFLLVTNSGDQYGSWNGLRPFYFNLANGNVTMGHNLTVSGFIIGRFNCRRVNSGWTNVAYASCNANERVMSGGGACAVSGGNHAFLLESFPNAELTYWQADCHFGNNANGAVAMAYAICCQIN